MSNLFRQAAQDAMRQNAPLADRMRPRTLDEFVGQEHILGKGRLLRRAIEADRVGCGWACPGLLVCLTRYRLVD